MQGVKRITPQEVLADLGDPRKHRVLRYPLAEIMFVVFAGLLCGETSYVGMIEIAEERIDLYRQYLPFANGIPGIFTLEHVLSRLDPDRLHELFVQWMSGAIEEFRENGGMISTIAIDGKQARRTKDRDKKALHVVTAFDSASQLVLGQLACAEKSNEITAIPDLIEMIDVRDALVTIDAIGTQHTIANLIIEKGGDYLLSVKNNRRVQFREMRDCFAERLETGTGNGRGSLCYACTRDGEHGRFDKRECWMTDDLSELPQTQKWKAVKGAAMVRRTSENLDGKKTVEVRYLFFSRKMTAEEVLHAVRKHWGIENGLHWVLDVTFREDDSRARIGHSAENLNVIRHMVFNILRPLRDGKKSIPSLQRKCMLNDSFFSQVIGSAGFMTEM